MLTGTVLDVVQGLLSIYDAGYIWCFSPKANFFPIIEYVWCFFVILEYSTDGFLRDVELLEVSVTRNRKHKTMPQKCLKPLNYHLMSQIMYWYTLEQIFKERNHYECTKVYDWVYMMFFVQIGNFQNSWVYMTSYIPVNPCTRRNAV